MKRFAPLFLAAMLFAVVADAGVYFRTRAVTGNTTIKDQDSLVVVTATGGAKTATLPPCPSTLGRYGQQIWVSNAHASDSAVTITRAGSATIGFAGTTLSLASADDSAWLTCGESNRWKVGVASTLAGAETVTSLTNSGAETTTGVINANGGIDRSTAAALAVGAANATAVNFTPPITVGGGYGSTGCSVSAAGVLECNGAITTDGAATALSAVIGGGFGSSGVTVSSAGAIQADAGITGTMYLSTAQAFTVADSGNGSAATGTLTPTSSVVVVTCSDADGCTVTMGEGSAAAGQVVTVVNTSANAASFADTAGVSEIAGAFVMGQYDTLKLVYAGTTWIETGRSNN